VKPLLLGLVAVLAAGCGGDDGDHAPTGPAEVTALHYDWSIDLATREAATAVTLRVDQAGNCLPLQFAADDLGDLALDGEPASDSGVQRGTLMVCGRGWEAGQEVLLTGTMTVPDETWEDSQVGYSVTTDLEGAPFTYLVSWVEGCDHFGPCDAAPDRFARYRFTVAHPAGTQVLCSCVVTAGASETVCDFDHAGGPTYSTFGLAASPSWVARELGDWAGVRVTLYDTPSTGLGDEVETDVGAGFMAWMIDRFGPYPYGHELRLVVGPTYWSGFEHPGNIVLDDSLHRGVSAYADPLDHVLIHEIAHQWAGDQTTLADTYDFVWKEAMAEYLAFVYEEEIDPDAAARTARAWKGWSASAAYHPVPDGQPALLDYDGDAYGPGPMVLFRQLEALFDRDAVLAAIGTLLGEERAIGVAEVQAALEASTGAQLGGYFERWVYGSGAPAWPEVEVAWAPGAAEGSVDVTVRQLLADGEAPAGCAFAVRLFGATAEELEDVWFDFGVDGAAELTVTATLAFTVTDHCVDPDAFVLVYDVTADAAALLLLPPWVRADRWPLQRH
jgi:aminopeptidase N